MVDDGTKITIRMSNEDIQNMEDFMADNGIESRSDLVRSAISEYIARSKTTGQADAESIIVHLNPVVLQTLENMRADGTIFDGESYIRQLINENIIPKEAVEDSKARAFRAAQQSSRIL